MRFAPFLLSMALLGIPGYLGAAKPRRQVASPAHAVKRGETAAKIAKAHGLTLDQLADLNPRVNLSKLSVGCRLAVAGRPEPVVARKAPQAAPPVAAPEPAAAEARMPVSPLPLIPAKKPSALVHLERLIPTSLKLFPASKYPWTPWKSF